MIPSFSLKVDFCDVPTTINVPPIQIIQVLQETETYSILYKSCSIVTNYFLSRRSILENE